MSADKANESPLDGQRPRLGDNAGSRPGGEPGRDPERRVISSRGDLERLAIGGEDLRISSCLGENFLEGDRLLE